MHFMNEFDLESARSRFTRATCPNRLALVMVVDNLREWADSVSDGWAYWPKPVRACAKAFEYIDSGTWAEMREQEENDISDTEVQAAVRPIKAFLTKMAKERHHRFDRPLVTPEEREIILRAAA